MSCDGPIQLDQLGIDRACGPYPGLELAEESGVAGEEGEVARFGHGFNPKERPAWSLNGRPPVASNRTIVPQKEIDTIQGLVANLIPDLVPVVVRTGTHLDAYTPDGQPLIGPLNSSGNVLAAAGFSGRGFKMAPVIGRILAELALNGASRIGVSRWRPRRFERR
jgi:glycine/D-amino acid oxidase-like deaminating enzyme